MKLPQLVVYAIYCVHKLHNSLVVSLIYCFEAHQAVQRRLNIEALIIILLRQSRPHLIIDRFGGHCYMFDAVSGLALGTRFLQLICKEHLVLKLLFCQGLPHVFKFRPIRTVTWECRKGRLLSVYSWAAWCVRSTGACIGAVPGRCPLWWRSVASIP